jgi:hypothetical protein
MLMTDTRLLWASVKPPGHWQALDLMMVAEHGIILPRQRMLTVGGSSDGGYKSWEFRPREPSTFDDLPWPAAAMPFIERWLETSDEFAQSMRPSRLIRRLFGRSRQSE